MNYWIKSIHLVGATCFLLSCSSFEYSNKSKEVEVDYIGNRDEETVEINNIKYGLVKYVDGSPEIYAYGDPIIYHENMYCQVNNEVIGCLEFGFEFDFESTSNNPILSCTTKVSEIVQWHDSADGKMKQISQEFSLEIKMTGSSGKHTHTRHYFKPAIAYYNEIDFLTDCMYQGRLIASFEQTAIIDPEKWPINEG